jgi:hypothetical protein
VERNPIPPDNAVRELSGPPIAMNILPGRAFLPA